MGHITFLQPEISLKKMKKKKLVLEKKTAEC